jgi:hypothetical protein
MDSSISLLWNPSFFGVLFCSLFFHVPTLFLALFLRILSIHCVYREQEWGILLQPNRPFILEITLPLIWETGPDGLWKYEWCRSPWGCPGYHHWPFGGSVKSKVFILRSMNRMEWLQKQRIVILLLFFSQDPLSGVIWVMGWLPAQLNCRHVDRCNHF